MDTMGEIKTLGDFIEDQLKTRNMTAREFSDFLGVVHRMVDVYRFHGIKPDVGTPRHEFLTLLADKTGTNRVIVFALAYGLAEALEKLQSLPPSALSRAEQIEQLPGEIREIIDDIISKRANKRSTGNDSA